MLSVPSFPLGVRVDPCREKTTPAGRLETESHAVSKSMTKMVRRLWASAAERRIVEPMSGWAAHNLLGTRPWDGPASEETFVRVLSTYALGYGRESPSLPLPGLSVTELQDRCDLSRPSITGLIQRFSKVLEPQTGTGTPIGSGLSTPRRWMLRAQLGHYLALDAGGRRTEVASFDLAGRKLQSAELNSPGEDADETITEAVSWFKQVANPDHVVGIGVSLAAPVDPLRGVRGYGGAAGHASRWDDWQRTSVLEQLRDLMGADAPVVADNDANLSALAEYVWGAAAPSSRGNRPQYSNVVYVKWSRGIGVGLILGGVIFRGEGIAGEIGHTIVSSDDALPACRNCGHHGCLEAVAGADAILHGRPSTDIEEAATIARDPSTPEADGFRRAARQLAVALGPLINVLNPQLVIIGGEVGRYAYDVVRHELRRALVKTTIEPTLADVTVVGSKLDDAALRGAAVLLTPLTEPSPWLLRFLRRATGA
jgi:predicted NBD/HSP70 family sugar kinase